ncbi:glycosyltransferase [Geotalea daltonii FRC-32]|uniref:Glycosyltransferase n=1 Tax=Geotalea daltonii (strain DSM 22248 / JCM 15807 / FRC-32) TaxID=316067 RepID=B9M559_GEODF|nr:glycosyltransferase [Geotalea daltonii]ACM19814.1 glycosyltransferase [Geotalea daltonii FRC-32]
MVKVSVIIPTYNRSELLKCAITSVLDQAYDNYELLIIDDGSTDDTKSIVNGFGSPKIRYIYQSNSGRSSARNYGIKLSKGEYVSFLDSDDIFLPNKLSLQVQALDENPNCGLVYAYAKNVDENGRFLDFHFDGNLSGKIYPEMLYIKNNYITTPTVMVRAKVLAQIGGFNESMHMCEDLDLWRRIARKYEVKQICQSLAHVRIRTTEKMNILEYMRGRKQYYVKAMIDDHNLKAIAPALFVEMYRVYLNCAKYQKQYFVLLYILFQYLLFRAFNMGIKNRC